MPNDNIKMTDEEICRVNTARRQYAMDTGHLAYMETAVLNEDMYLGGGLQWREADRAEMGERPMIELNHIMPAINTATGLQLHSRVDMSFLPRGEGADEKSAEVVSKVITQICDDINYSWEESQMFEDGLIQQRGFVDIRMAFAKNLKGDIEMDVLDPLDVKPDPDARSYDPRKWKDVMIDRWYTIDDIEQFYGEEKALEVRRQADSFFDDYDNYLNRSHFNEDSDGRGFEGWVTQEKEDVSTRLHLVIDRQHRRILHGDVFVSFTGEITPKELMDDGDLARASETGVFTKMTYRRIRWTVTCGGVVLHDDWSPYKTFTIVPYFPYFRRGRTRGMVDNLRSPQELENKSITNYLEILGSSSNSGWDVPQNSLVNMEPEDLEKNGSKNGLVLVYKANKAGDKPTKRQASAAPIGAEKLIDRAEFAIKTISGMSDALQGKDGNEVSGVALGKKQYMGQTQMGRPLDNLSFTRRIIARKFLELVQQFYTYERIIRIIDRETKETKEEITINEATIDGLLNDLSLGKYDVVIDDTPTHATYQEGQFGQVMDMKTAGVQIPDRHIISASSYSKKHELIKDLDTVQAPDPTIEAKVEEIRANIELKKAQAKKTENEAVSTAVESKYSAIQTAGVISENPSTAPLADIILRSSGDVDMDRPPLIPEYPGDAQNVYRGKGEIPMQLPANTNPITPVPAPDPASPHEGQRQGIETQEID